MSATLTSQRELIARLNDLARQAMGVACTAVATVGFQFAARGRSILRPRVDRGRSTPSTRTTTRTANAISGQSTSLPMVAGRPSARLCHEDERERVFWKLDYYDRQMEFASDDAANPAVTRRVLTIMLSDEY